MKIFPLVLFCLLTLMVSPAQSGPDSLALVTVPSFKPFVWQQEGKARGIDADIVKELCRRSDLVCRVEFHPWSRVLAEVESGRAAGGFTGFRTPERLAYAHFLDHPLHFSTYSIFVASGREFDFSGVADLYGKTVGINRDFAVNVRFKEAVAKGWIQVEEVDSLAQNIRKLLAGNRIDAVIGNYHKMKLKITELGVNCEVSCLPVPIVPPRPAYLMISRKWQHQRKKEILNRMNRELKSMYDDGTVDRINSEYLN